MIVARHLCSELDCCCFDFISQCQKQDGDFGEIVYFTPLGFQPIYEAIAVWVDNEFAELDEVLDVVALSFANFLDFLSL